MIPTPTTPELAPIRKLPALLVNQIAAGEVVERPASVVKELIDNALDAGASRITLELRSGGIELVRVTDNGRGIPAGDLPLAIAPHATSKISAAADLDKIATMGFRGEALASIASVSRLGIRSRTAAQVEAAELNIEGDVVGAARPASGPVGTSVTVRNLFFNTPARRKFLRTPTTEQGHCVDAATALALSHLAVGFDVSADERTVLDLPPDQSPRERALAVLGAELEHQLLEVHADRFDDARGMALWGLAGLPALARATAKSQYLFLNGRPIRDRTVQHAVKEAYRGLIDPGRYPTVVLLIEMDPGAVDVNVHPQKTEVRFRDGSMVHSTVLRALREALQAADLTPEVAWGAGGGGRPGAAPTPQTYGLPGAG
ncbi:MAG: DNA mismatch repair endonuclease MutL, partial [Phycisphaerales bacterium]|nr:DNA mismatch repair endonuclease MutL [Phycisphaerales bacterium]